MYSYRNGLPQEIGVRASTNVGPHVFAQNLPFDRKLLHNQSEKKTILDVKTHIAFSIINSQRLMQCSFGASSTGKATRRAHTHSLQLM